MENATSSMNLFDTLAELIAAKFFNGTLARCPGVIAETFLGVITRDLDLPETIPVSIREEARKRFADCLSLALADRIAAQSVAENSKFKNDSQNLMRARRERNAPRLGGAD